MMEAEWSLRPATRDDIPKVLEIEKICQPASWTADHFSAELEKSHSNFLIMTDDETDSKIAAFIVYWILMDECQILNLCVAPEFRRKGIAERLVRQAIKDAIRNNAKKVSLEVRKSNDQAINLYQKLGFVITHIQKELYSNKEDGYQMSLLFEEGLINF